MHKIFNKGLKEENKKEGLLKRLKKIEDENEEQLKAIKNKTENIKEDTDFVKKPLTKRLIEKIKITQKELITGN